jgi:hypothetical protein
MPSAVIQNIVKYIVDSGSYARMQAQDCKGIDDSMAYATFLNWNIKCLNELPDKELDWLTVLCDRLKQGSLNLMDLESCAVFTAHQIYFNMDKEFCLVNPR